MWKQINITIQGLDCGRWIVMMWTVILVRCQDLRRFPSLGGWCRGCRWNIPIHRLIDLYWALVQLGVAPGHYAWLHSHYCVRITVDAISAWIFDKMDNYFKLLKMDIFVLKSFILKYLLVYLKQKTAIHSSLAFSEHLKHLYDVTLLL